MATIIRGVRARYESVGSTANTLESLVESERSERRYRATFCLVNLIRGLSLTCKALQYMQKDPKTQLYTCFQMSYDQVLRPYHSWVIKTLAYLVIRSAPNRCEFYTRLSEGADSDKFDAKLTEWLAALDEIVGHMSNFLEQGGFGRV